MRFLLIFTVLFIGKVSQSQTLVSAELIGTMTQQQLDIIGFIVPDYGVRSYKLVYNTTDANGQATIASGLLSVPDTDECYGFPIAVYMHGTVLNKEDVPSRDNTEASITKFIGGLGYYSLAPDYIGMGDSPGLHPYLHAESEATAGVDMVRAAREFISAEGMVENGEVFITGYSQGGHAAMAMHKYIEDNALLDDFNIIASGPASGPYGLSTATTDDILSGDPYTNPGYLVYLLSSYELAYDNLYSDYSEVLQSPYDQTVVPYFDGNNTSLTMTSLNNQLTPIVEDLLDETMYAEFSADLTHPLRVNLAANDNDDWTPTRPINMYYCDQDEQVASENTTLAQSNFEANGSTVTSQVLIGSLDHANCFLPAMLGVMNYFNSLKSDCTVGLNEWIIDIQVTINQSNQEIQISSDETLTHMKIVDSTGRVIAQDKLNGQSRFTKQITSLSPGIYHLEVISVDGARGVGSFLKNWK